MSLLVNTTYRSQEKEIMDDLSMEGSLLRDTLDKIATINRLLGGNNVTLKGLKKILKSHPKGATVTIIDLGCGQGDILREAAKLGKKSGYDFKLIGIDANADTIAYAKELSVEYPQINFKQIDIFSTEFEKLEYDIVLATLFFHHFKEPELINFLKKITAYAKTGVVVNDLHRSKMAYYLYQFIMLPVRNQMVKYDGAISILRGFKKSDLVEMSNKINVSYSVQWKWAFRFLWILKPLKKS